MRLSHILTAILVSLSVTWAAETKNFVQPKEKEIGIYKNMTREVYEQPVSKATSDDRLLIVEEKGNYYKVQNAVGETGWVEKRLVIKIGKSKTFVFENAEIVGYLDNPTPVYILDSDDPNAERIHLDRSFKDALRDNTDKETIERQAK